MDSFQGSGKEFSEDTPTRWAPKAVTNGVITPLIGVITSVTHL